MAENSLETLLAMLRREAALTDLDLHFARLLARLDPKADTMVLLCAALVSAAAAQGHTCLDLEALAGQCRKVAPECSADHLKENLRHTFLAGDGSKASPLVMDRERVYLHRYWQYEDRLAHALQAHAVPRESGLDDAALQGFLDGIFGREQESGRGDWQKVAAALALVRGLTIISGGPGSGKTTTVVRILALMCAAAGNRPMHIALAAPTGKAAARMQQAVLRGKTGLPLPPDVPDRVPDTATTIHRLLGARPGSTQFRHNRDNPLPIDVLVVDEMSMVDLALMTKLVEATPPHAAIILLGDRDQLASVEPGSVFGELCAGADGFTAACAARLSSLTGVPVPASPASVLPDTCVLLKKSFRFDDRKGIGSLARAINEGNGAAALEICNGGRDDVVLRECIDQFALDELLRTDLLPTCLEAIEQARAGGEKPEQVFATYARTQLLCAHRRGGWGADALNLRIETALRAKKMITGASPWYVGRPVIVTANDYAVGLYNGDLGIAMASPDSETLRVCFPDTGKGVRWIHPARLPAHETAWAMTVHKSQGSEFDRVVLVLPGRPSEILTRELLYTGITRAKTAVTVWGTADVLACAVKKQVARHSGLQDRLATSGG